MAVIYGKIFAHELKYPFSIARYTKTHQDALIICYEHNGIRGFGECTSNAYYNFEVNRAFEQLNITKNELAKLHSVHPTRFWEHARGIIEHPFLLCALDEAYWDWYGKNTKKHTRELLEIDTEQCPLTSYTIGIDSLDIMEQKIVENPWPLYKIKLSKEHHADFVNRLLQMSNATFCIDANASWSYEKATTMIDHLPEERILFIEQALDKSQWENMKRLKSRASICLIADESCINEADIDKCYQSFDGINIKLMKCGGITPAIRMIKLARQLNLSIMLGCMAESSVGISAAAQLAPLVDFVDLDGAMLLANDPAQGIRWTPKGINWPDRYGNGVSCKAL